MENYCKQCGQCCRAICLTHSLDYLRTRPEACAKFIVTHWKAITQEEALRINPQLHEWIKKRSEFYTFHFYTCSKFDNKTNKCLVYQDEQPWICSGYPFYGKNKIKLSELFYIPDCGYNKEELKELQK